MIIVLIAFGPGKLPAYGYLALLIGTFLEGETILIIGGLLAKLGLLKLSTVMVVAFIGSFSGDRMYFYLGYFKGREVLSKHPKWGRRVDRVHKVIERYRNLIMLGFQICLWHAYHDAVCYRFGQADESYPVFDTQCNRCGHMVHNVFYGRVFLRI